MRMLFLAMCCSGLTALGQDAVVRLSFDKTTNRLANTGSDPSFTFASPTGASYATVTRSSGRVSFAFDASTAQPLWVLNGSQKLDARNFTVAVATTPASTANWRDVFNIVLDLDDDGAFTAAGNDRFLSFQRGGGVNDFRVYYYANTTSGNSLSGTVNGANNSTVVYLVFSVADGVGSFYVNGAKASTTHTIAAAGGSESCSVYGISLGRRWTATTVNGSNKVDDVQFFGRGFSDAEVRALYQQFQALADATATLPEGEVNWNDLVWRNAAGNPVEAPENLFAFNIEAPVTSTLIFPEGWSIDAVFPAIEQLQFTVTGHLTLSGLTAAIAPAVASVANGATLSLQTPGLIPARMVASGGALRLAGGDALAMALDNVVDSNATLVIDKEVSHSALNWAGSRTLKITENGRLTINGLFRTGAGNASADSVNQTGGTVLANGDAGSQVGTGSEQGYKKGPLLLGYWGGANTPIPFPGARSTCRRVPLSSVLMEPEIYLFRALAWRTFTASTSCAVSSRSAQAGESTLGRSPMGAMCWSVPAAHFISPAARSLRWKAPTGRPPHPLRSPMAPSARLTSPARPPRFPEHARVPDRST